MVCSRLGLLVFIIATSPGHRTAHQSGQRILKALHPTAFVNMHVAGNLKGTAVPDEIPYRGLATTISKAAIIPLPLARGTSTCDSIAIISCDICNLIWFCWLGGKISMRRSMVCAASVVCSVLITRWPVSAAVIAVEMVSRSRISPTTSTLGHGEENGLGLS